MAKQRIVSKNSKFKSQMSQNVKIGNIKIAKGVKKRSIAVKLQDARQKIIQKKRKTVVDARDILAKKAKTQDARNKINKIRNGRSPGSTPNSSIKVIGSNILRKTDRNGKISLVTNKAKLKSDINLAIQKQLGLIPSSRSPIRKSAPKRNAAVNTIKSPIAIRKTIMNEIDYPSDSSRLHDSTLYKWTKPELRASASQILNLETTRQVMRETLREELSNSWPTYASHLSSRPMRLAPMATPQLRSHYTEPVIIDEDEEMPMVRRSSDIRSRLDGGIGSRPESHGIFSHSQVKAKSPVIPVGHRIVVSNLQPSVTQDDIKELFEDIGQLISAKLVRTGVAEVIYKNLKDAQKAVDTYHNRQLDGQPMKCLLVNKRPLNQPTALPITKSESFMHNRLGHL